jgi:hypothetical protein
LKSAAPTGAPRKLGGLLVRKERWALSWKGNLVVLALCLAAWFIFLRSICPFLGVTAKTGGPLLVIEGWIPPTVLHQAAAEYKTGQYQHVLIVRPILLGTTNKYESGEYYGDYVANLLVEYGIPKESLDTIFCPNSRKDRTYHSALAARRWLAAHYPDVRSFDLATFHLHARRSRLLYEKAFAGQDRIGIIALDDPTYDPRHWWRYSEGVREVISEGTAYLYARFLFHASADDFLQTQSAAR